MTRKELYKQRQDYFLSAGYQCIFYKDFNFDILDKIMYIRKPGRNGQVYSDCIIMLDTETSKATPGGFIEENHLVAWTISIRAFHMNICTLYGHKPSECIDCLNKMLEHLSGEKTFVYIFNASYDWVFLRKFMLKEYGIPVKQLNTKPHYPIYIEFANGLVLRDALILAQRKLEKWAEDMDVEHKKAVGSWDYDLIRNQDHVFTPEEIHYIENDTLAGVECLDKLMESINKEIYSIPWTATGIPRDEIKKRGKEHNGYRDFKSQLLAYDQQKIMERVFHGGYTHGNRLYYNDTVFGIIDAYDFASSYPFCMLSEKYPAEMFTPMKDRSISDILGDKDNNAYFFKLILINAVLRDRLFPMPYLQYSKCLKTINADVDNGRILSCDYAEIWITELDLEIIAEQYEIERHICTNVYAAHKDYLPRWYTDYIFEMFEQKTMLKGKDRVLYNVAKGKLNSLYGMTVQRPAPWTINENYETGEFTEDDQMDPEEEYSKYGKRKTNVLNYQIGVWTTAYAARNLFRLGSCAGTWLYSDTDSCYGLHWDMDKLKAYNMECMQKLIANGYGPVINNGRQYWLGVAEHDGRYTQFKQIHAKCYCCRSAEDGELHITVAGVPKKGADVLQDDISNFRPGCIFPGTVTGKKTYTYFFMEDIHTDENGNEIGDSIDMSPCDYLLSAVYTWEDMHQNYIEVPYYV